LLAAGRDGRHHVFPAGAMLGAWIARPAPTDHAGCTLQGKPMPIHMTCTGCGKPFRLRDEMAGRKVRCPECEAILVVPALPPMEVAFDEQEGSTASPIHPAFDRDRFLLRQKVIAISEKYLVWDDQERPILFVERPAHLGRIVLAAVAATLFFIATFAGAVATGLALSQKIEPKLIGFLIMVLLMVLSLILTLVVGISLSPKRHISFYTDEEKDVLLLRVLQDKKFQPVIATYTVLTPEGDVLGHMKKNYMYNIVRRKWDVVDSQGRRVLVAREDSLLLSLLRRVLGPMLGFLRANFILVVPQADRTELTRGEFNRNFTLFDRYVLDLTRDRPRMIDRRLAIALGVLLDTGEHR
jgi:hypothetical protein